jgi:hypothetical protein
MNPLCSLSLARQHACTHAWPHRSPPRQVSAPMTPAACASPIPPPPHFFPSLFLPRLSLVTFPGPPELALAEPRTLLNSLRRRYLTTLSPMHGAAHHLHRRPLDRCSRAATGRSVSAAVASSLCQAASSQTPLLLLLCAASHLQARGPHRRWSTTVSPGSATPHRWCRGCCCCTPAPLRHAARLGPFRPPGPTWGLGPNCNSRPWATFSPPAAEFFYYSFLINLNARNCLKLPKIVEK